MITVYFIRGEEKIPVQVDEGMSLMEAARDFANQSIEEIPADCSGCCACATCHVLIDRNWTHIIGQPDLNSAETELVEYEKGYDRMQSRLACQIQQKKNTMVWWHIYLITTSYNSILNIYNSVFRGALAQLGERLICIQEVISSTLICSTKILYYEKRYI